MNAGKLVKKIVMLEREERQQSLNEKVAAFFMKFVDGIFA